MAARNEGSGYFLRLARLAHRLERQGLEGRALAAAAERGPIAERLELRQVDLLLRVNDDRAALEVAQRAYERLPQSRAAILKLAFCHRRLDNLEAAEECLRRGFTTVRRCDPLVLLWGRLVIDDLRDPARVVASIQSMWEKLEQSWIRPLLMGKAYAAMSMNAEAQHHLEGAARLAPAVADTCFELALFQRRIGKTQASQESLQRVIDLDERNITALRLFGMEHQHQYGDKAFTATNVALANIDRHSTRTQVEIHYAAAKAFDDTGELATAFAHYARAG